jgi:hypothetical protein
MTTIPTPAEFRARQRALRTMLAVETEDLDAMGIVLTEAHSDPELGVAELILALARAANANARELLAPDSSLAAELRYVIVAEDALAPDPESGEPL